MTEISSQHAAVDRYIAGVFAASPEKKPCCTIGCFACCSEPVYASEAEVIHILEYLTPEQIAEVKIKLVDWLAKTKPLMDQNMPGAVAYRQLKAPCVLLKNGLCSVYPRRPYGCRAWFAFQNPGNCDLPYREHQGYAQFSNKIFEVLNGLVFINGKHIIDHLGILLAEKLLGRKRPSGSRLTDTRND